MSKPAPDPSAVREASLDELRRLAVPLPPPAFPLVWEPGDSVELRGSHLVDQVTPPEWQFVMGARGDHRSFVLHHDAVFALAWLLGLSRHLDPTAPPEDRLMRQMPNLPQGEMFADWRSRSLVAPRDPVEAAVLLDLYYCLDWSFQDAERLGLRLPGEIGSDAIGQR